jgi:hypothetical protein
LVFQTQGPVLTTFARENRSRRNLHGNEKEGKKEETLTVRETILAYATNFTGLLREAPLEGLFLLRGFAFLDHKRQGSANLAVLTKIGRDNSAPAGLIESALGRTREVI